MDSMDNCDTALFIHINRPGTVCPIEEVNYPEVYISPNPSSSVNEARETAERRVIDLRTQSVNIIQEIQKLEYAKANLISEVEKTQEIIIPKIESTDLNKDLQHKVNVLASKEALATKQVFDTQAEKPKPVNSTLDLQTKATTQTNSQNSKILEI